MEPEDAPHDLGSSASPDANAPLNGTLEDYSPAGALQVLSSQRATGAVRFNGEAGCTVYLHEGQLYFAETAETGEALAVALVRPGRLSPDEWDDATQAGYPTSEVGNELLRTGAIDRELLASVVLSVIYDPLIHLFRQGEGAFEFEPGTIHWMGPFRTFDLEAIVAEVRRRVREADEMADLIPHLGVTVATARSLPTDRGSVNLRRDDWEIAIAAATGRRIDELAVELGRGQWSTARLVYRLAAAGLLEVTDDADVYETPTADAFASPQIEEAPETTDAWAQPAEEWSATTDSWSDSTTAWATETEPSADDETARHGFADAFESSDTETSINLTPGASDWSTPPPLDTTNPWGSDDTESDEATTLDNSSWASATDEWGSSDSWGTSGDSWEPDGWSEPAAEAPRADSAPADPDLDDQGFDAPASGDHGITFDMPNLHPDIAKALAESTYADSATAINAMAARLGAAAAADDDEDWDDSAEDETDVWAGVDTGTPNPWGEEAPEPTSAGEGSLGWAPQQWDTGVEAAPLPHRARSFAEEPGPAGPADPEWLENLYAEFMSHPEEGSKKASNANPVEAAFAASPEQTATKNRTLRRVISAIRRL